MELGKQFKVLAVQYNGEGWPTPYFGNGSFRGTEGHPSSKSNKVSTSYLLVFPYSKPSYQAKLDSMFHRLNWYDQNFLIPFEPNREYRRRKIIKYLHHARTVSE